jgi:hypothetical protein
VTKELPLGVLCCSASRALALLGVRLSRVAPLSLSSDPAFGEQARRLYRQTGGDTPPKVIKILGRLLQCRCGGIEV